MLVCVFGGCTKYSHVHVRRAGKLLWLWLSERTHTAAALGWRQMHAATSLITCNYVNAGILNCLAAKEDTIPFIAHSARRCED